MGFGWQSERLCMVPLDKERHHKNCCEWMNDPEVTKWLSLGYVPITSGKQMKWLDRMDSSETDITFAVELHDGTYIGNTSIHKINWRNRSAQTGTLIGSKTHWNQGFGTEAAILRCLYCFQILGLRQITSSIYSNNVASIKMLKRVGYQVYGEAPNWDFNLGKYETDLKLIITREEFMQRYPDEVIR